MTQAGLIYTTTLAVLIAVDLYLNMVRRPAWLEDWNFCYSPIYCAINVLMAGYQIGQGNRTGAAIYSSIALVVFLVWWFLPRNRNRRRKWAKRFHERVVDLGGRLGVRRPKPTST